MRLKRDAVWVDVHVVLFDVDVERDVLVLQISQHRLTQVLKNAQVLERLVNLLLQLLLDAFQQFFLLSFQQAISSAQKYWQKFNVKTSRLQCIMLMTGLLVVTFVKAKRGLYQVSTVTGHGPMYHLHDCYYYNHNHCLQCMCLTLVSCHACLWLLALTCSVAEKPSVIPSRRKFESRFRNWKTNC